KLKLFTEVKNFVSEVETGAPVTTKRQAQTSVIVEDGDIVVIGGLIRNDSSQGVSKVPILGDIPLIGWLFRSSRKTEQKSNLLIFIKPHIINTAEQLRQLSDEKKNAREEMGKQFEEQRSRGKAIGEVLKEMAK
ncbi:MAG TPA: type II and III secretion system protein, partial [bacterium]|nr:type II and III secretion system protein [bacterium]